MATVGMILMGVGGIIMLIYGIILLIQAFKKSILWGLGYIFVPFVALIFVIKYWGECKTSFLRLLIGLVIYIVGIVLAGPSLAENMPQPA